jgi:AcrR family transcriptional regulator
MSKSHDAPIWARPEPGARRPRYTREQIAATALAIADQEGIEAVSMRRVATELGAGTMTLYHYVRTKDELIDLMDDAIMGQVLIPDAELPSNWREALAEIARRSRQTFARHPWALEGLRGARGGPNGMRHFEQSLAAVASLDIELADKLELVCTVDDYVFGYVLRADLEATQKPGDAEFDEKVLPYLEAQLETGDYPNIATLFEGLDPASGFELVMSVFRDEARFERGLQRLLAGLEAGIARTPSTPGRQTGDL